MLLLLLDHVMLVLICGNLDAVDVDCLNLWYHFSDHSITDLINHLINDFIMEGSLGCVIIAYLSFQH